MNTPFTTLRKRLSTWLMKPKIWSTVEAELGLKSLHDDSWRRLQPAECSVFSVDQENLFWRWKALNELFDVDYSEDMNNEWDARDVMCAMDLPKGDTKLVFHSRPVPWESPKAFLFSDCYFLLRSLQEYIDNEQLNDSLGGNEERPDKQTAKPSLCTILEMQWQNARAQSASAPRGDAVRVQVGDQGQYGTFDQAHPTVHHELQYVQYFLCCEGLRQSKILDMVGKVAIDVGEQKGYVALICPWDAKEFMEDLLSQVSKPFVDEHEFLFQFVITKDLLRSLDLRSKEPVTDDGKRADKTRDRTKPPMVIFLGNTPYKLLWHTRGWTVVKKEYEIQFTGTGVRVARLSVVMWLTLALGFGLTLFYGIYRGLSSDVSLEDILQTALSIAALYVATVIPMVYSLCYNDENLGDVVTGRVHLDKRSEFKQLSKEEKLYLCLRSIKKRESDRRFIDKENTCYLSGTVAGGAMHVSCMPCIGNLLMMGYQYWEHDKRKGLLSSTGEVFELMDVDATVPKPRGPPLKQRRDHSYRCQFMHAQKRVLKKEIPPGVADCPFEHYYVGFGS